MRSETVRGDVSLSAIYHEKRQKLRRTDDEDEHAHGGMCDRANTAKYESDGYEDIRYDSSITFFTFEDFHDVNLGEEQKEIMGRSRSRI